MRRLLAALVALALGGVIGCAPATPSAGPGTPQLAVEDAWVRTTTGAKDAGMTAAFMTIVNPGTEDARLVAAECADAGLVQVHEMVVVKGTKLMQEAKDGATVPAGSHLHLVPGGYHIMLMQLRRPLPVGENVTINLRFSDGVTLPVNAPVKDFVEEEDHYHSPEPTPAG